MLSTSSYSLVKGDIGIMMIAAVGDNANLHRGKNNKVYGVKRIAGRGPIRCVPRPSFQQALRRFGTE